MIYLRIFGRLAQMVERQVEALRVRGSIPLPSIACILVLSGFWLSAETKKMQAKKLAKIFALSKILEYCKCKEENARKRSRKNVRRAGCG